MTEDYNTTYEREEMNGKDNTPCANCGHTKRQHFKNGKCAMWVEGKKCPCKKFKELRR